MTQSNKIIIGIIIAVLVIWGGYALYQGSLKEETEPTGPVKIGWIGPLSGGAASYGESIKRGVQMAINEFDPGTVEVIFEDSKCEGKDAVSAATKLISIDGVEAIVGEVCSGATLAVAPIANQNEVVLISPASTSPKLSDSGEYVFRTVPSDALQGKFGAELAYNQGYRKLAVLYSNEEYGLGFNNVLNEAFPALGGEVVANEAFDREEVDLRTQITKVKSAEPDVIYLIVNNPEPAVAALKQLRELGVNVTVIGSEGLKSQDILDESGGASEGLIVTSVSAGTEGFAERHRADYDSEEPGPFAAQGYDAMRAVSLAIVQGARTGPAIKDALRNISFTGASGSIVFDENGDIAGNYEVVVAEGGVFVPFEAE